jgi:LuxR family maltose regulon positive regulatory protein
LEETARALWREQQPPHAFDQGLLVLSGRLVPPRLPNALVERKPLLSALDGALATPLTLLSAPAGFGKTTLLATWARRHEAPVAWLSLDELDTSPTRFWVALIAALRRGGGVAPSFGETAVALLASPQPPPLPTILVALLQELESHEAHPAPIVLIVDDYQVIEEPAIHQGMSFFLEHLPAHVHLLLASRVDPDLPLARWRVRGQLTEIRADALRFQEGEASQYLGQLLSPPLSEEEDRGLDRRLAPGGPHPAEAHGSRGVPADALRQPALSVGLCAGGDPLALARARARLFTPHRHPLAPGRLGVPGGDRRAGTTGQPADACLSGARQSLPGVPGRGAAQLPAA